MSTPTDNGFRIGAVCLVVNHRHMEAVCRGCGVLLPVNYIGTVVTLTDGPEYVDGIPIWKVSEPVQVVYQHKLHDHKHQLRTDWLPQENLLPLPGISPDEEQELQAPTPTGNTSKEKDHANS